MRRLAGAGFAVALVLALVSLAGPMRASPLRAQTSSMEDDGRFAGLQWRFVRVKYHAWTTEPSSQNRLDGWAEPWAIDGPAAEQNLTRRLRSVTSVQVGEPIALALDDPRLFQNPWIYIVEGGNLRLRDHEVGILREFLLRGGTLTFDDFHGPWEWANVEGELKKVFPGRPIVEIAPPHPIYSCFYMLDHYPQIPGLGSFLQGRTWEKGGFVPHLRGILDDAGRVMVLINWNTDTGDGVEWSNAEEYPGYVKYSAEAYRIFINEIIYALTH